MQYTVLVAEDEPLALKTVCSIIENRCPNFRVAATAENGREALDKVRELKPDLVISDIKMPLLSGVEMAEIIHRELLDICVLIISGYADFEYAQSAIRSGDTDYLLKPIVPSSLKASMDYTDLQAGRYQVVPEPARTVAWRHLQPGGEYERDFGWSNHYLPRR